MAATEKKAKKWMLVVILFFVIILAAVALLLYIFDPALKFHKESSLLTYYTYNQLYSGPGVAKQYDYDTVVTGSCMVQQIDIAQVNDLFNSNAVKLTYNGATAKNIKTILDICFQNKSSIKSVIAPLDTFTCIGNYQECRYELPSYMYSDNILNDMKYLLNINVSYHLLLNDILGTIQGKQHLAMESEPELDREYGAELVLNSYEPSKKENYNQKDADCYFQNVYDNLEYNLLPTIQDHPETEFIFFIPPYSVLYWQKHNSTSDFIPEMEALRLTLESLLQYDNVKIYSFLGEKSIIENLDNYRDILHFGYKTEAVMMEKIAAGENRIDENTYNDKIDGFIDYVRNFDYDSFLKDWREIVENRK